MDKEDNVPVECKEKGKEGKGKTKPSPSIVLKELLSHPNATQDIKKILMKVDFDQEFDVVSVSKSVLKCAESSLNAEVERCIASLSVDAFDMLLEEKGREVIDLSTLEFYLHAVKSLTYSDLKFEGLGDFLQSKFKQSLIKVVLCDKMSDGLRSEASLISERIIEKNKYIENEEDGSGRWISVYLWVVKCCLKSDGIVRADVKRIWSMHKLLAWYSIPSGSPVFDVLAASAVSPNFLAHKEGRQHIGYLLSLDKALVAPLQAKIKAALPQIFEKSKVLACSYGEIFHMAWTNAVPQVREELEEEVIQRWMEIYLTLDRPRGLMQSQFGKVIFRILSYLHHSRRLIELSSAITRLYQPIIWRALKSHHPWDRCNAAELFLDVFPLEKPGSNIVENSNFKEKQFRQIMDLLEDESHYTRIVAIRGVTPIIERRMDCLSNSQCKEILSLLANTLTNDCSTYLVRVAVWEFFTTLVDSPDPPVFLITLLPQMTSYLHDVNEHVRKTFATMLLHIKRNKSLSVSYTDVASIPHIIARLALDGEHVGKVLAQLMMTSIYTEGMTAMQFMKNLRRLILMSPKAAENLFRWSPHTLTAANAKFIILSILVYLRAYTKERVEGRSDGSGKSTCLPAKDPSADDNDNSFSKENQLSSANIPDDCVNPSSPIKKKRRKSKENKKEKLSSVQSQDSDKDDEVDIDGPTAEMHAHMLGCAHVTWIVFFKQFQAEQEVLSELNSILTLCLQNYLRCYKGTPAWYAALSIASLVPITKLSESTTASSSCLGELRRTQLSTPLTHTEALIYTLTAWNRGNEIIDLAIDYIDPAFRLFHLNSTALASAAESGCRGRRTVRFAKDRGREMIGLRLLSFLIKDQHNETRLLLKHYDHLHELFLYLDGIKVIIETAVTEGLNEDSLRILTEEFMIEAFVLLLKLIPILNRDASESQDPPFSATQHMISIIEWVNRLLVPRVVALEENPLEEVDDEEVDDNSDDEHDDNDDEKVKKNRRTGGNKRKNKKKEEDNKEDLVVTCLKAVMKATTLMVRIDMTDTNHIAASAKLAFSLVQTEGSCWFLEQGLELLEAIGEHVRAWQPDDPNQLLSIVSTNLYSHILLSLTVNTGLTNSTLHRHKVNLTNLKRKLAGLPNLLLAMYGSSHSCFTDVLKSALEGCIAALHSQAIKMETVDTVSKMEELPVGVAIVTTCLISRPKLSSLILPTVVDIIRTNIEDGALVMCSLSYLYTVVVSYKKTLVQVDLERTVHSLYPLVSSLKPPSSNKQSDDDDSFFDAPLAKLDASKEGIVLLRKIADAIPCSMIPPTQPLLLNDVIHRLDSLAFPAVGAQPV